MKNIKDIVIGIFAVIGFFAIASGFSNNQAQASTPSVPESHVWSIHKGENTQWYSINAVTGEVRIFAPSLLYLGKYKVATEDKPKPPKEKKKK